MPGSHPTSLFGFHFSPFRHLGRKKSRSHSEPAILPISGSDDGINPASSAPISIPKKENVPEGPIKFESLGDGDAFIKALEEKHVETKRQLFDLSLRPASFDPRDELKAKVEPFGDQLHIMQSKKVQRMHFIGSYHFVNTEDFREEEQHQR